MTAGEFAFLALGLVLGLASGAALVEILRARPPARREVKVTVAPHAIQARHPATLADPTFSTGASQVARGGPADRRWVDRDPTPSGAPSPAGSPVEPVPPDAVTRTSVPSGPPETPLRFTPLAPPTLATAGPSGFGSSAPAAAAQGGSGSVVGIPLVREPDPMMTAMRASAPPTAEPDRTGWTTAGAAFSAQAGGATAIAEARPLAAVADDDPARPEPAAPVAIDDGPCAEERRIADERCAVAVRAREGAGQAAESLRQAQRAYDEHVARAEAEQAASDPRSVRAAKEAAQQAFRHARSGGATRDQVDAAARTWLSEVNRINHDTREALQRMERDRAAAQALAPQLERLAVDADAARITAEAAEEACVAAREAVAACDEARSVTTPAPLARSAPVAEDETIEEDVLTMASRAGEDPVVLRILRGDRGAMDRLVAQLAAGDVAAEPRWRAAITGLLDAVVARAIEAAALDFPVDHLFWGPFSRTQSRDIAAALSSLGYRFDGFGEWADERVPTQRDLSLAVGYAGLDPMRIRHWPTDTEMHELLRDVTVAADEYLSEAAGGLTLGEMLTLLGRRADGLTDLWNQWGVVRPLLLDGS